MQEHHYSLTELENMMPWEREVYVGMLIVHLKNKDEKAKEQAQRKIDLFLYGEEDGEGNPLVINLP